MRKILLFIVVLISVSVFGQPQERKLLENQARENDLRIKLNVSAYNFSYKRRGDEYRCGNSEVYLRLSESGYYTIELGNQMMSNPYGKYRFFDVNNGHNTLSIYKNNYLVYRTSVRVPNNSRVVLDYHRGRLYLLEVYRKHNDFDLWSDRYPISDNGLGSFPNDDWRERQPIDDFLRNSNRYGRNMMTVEQFRNFKKAVVNTSFDSDKLAVIEMQLRFEPCFNSNQIRELLGTISFDNWRLKAAKKLYKYCLDKENYYRVSDVFYFSSAKKELSQFVSSRI